jgi:DNA repair protein RadD
VSVFARACPQCGEPFVFKAPTPKHGATASDAALLTAQIEPEWCDVDTVYYALHAKPDRPTSIRVEYVCGVRVFMEWVMPMHSGWARDQARKWFDQRGSLLPTTIEEALELCTTPGFPEPKQILVRREGKFDRITNYRFEGRDEHDGAHGADGAARLAGDSAGVAAEERAA